MSDSMNFDELDANLEAETATSDSTVANPMLPYEPSNVFSNETMQKEVMEYVCAEILDVRDGSDRKELEAKWEKYRRMRRAKPETAQRTTPWKKSANVVPPLTQQKVNTIYAKEVSAFASKKPPVFVQAMNLEDAEKAESFGRFFKGMAESRNGLNMAKNLQTIFYEQVSMGTDFVKVPFLIDKWAFKRNSEAGNEQVTYTRHQGPSIVHIRLEDFFTRPYWKDLQRAPWIAVRYRFFLHELKQQGAMGAFDTKELEKVYSVPLTEYDENTLSSMNIAGVSVGSLGAQEPNKEFEIYECNVFWDVDGDGIPEDVKLWVEPETQTLLRSEFNPLSIRDIEPVIYFEDPDSLYAVGVCEMTESMQEEVSTLHNMRLDGTHLAMLKVWFARRGSGLGDEEFTPFKVMEMDDPMADIRPIDFPDVAPSCLSGEMIAREYADKVTGASDYMAGFNDKTVGSGATLGGTVYLAQQSNSILNSILQNAEISISNIYQIAFYQCVANKEKVDLSFLSAEDQANVTEILSMRVEDIPTKFRFIVKATDISKTDESRKQNFMAMSQMYSMYGEKALQVMQLLTQTQDPMQKEMLLKLLCGSTDFMAKMIEFFDVGDPKEYLPYLDFIKMQVKAYDDVRIEQTQAQKEALRNGNSGTNNAGVGEIQGIPGAMQPVGIPGEAGGQGAGGVPGGQTGPVGGGVPGANGGNGVV